MHKKCGDIFRGIGVGKSSLIRTLAKDFRGIRFRGFVEPVRLWKSVEGINLLDKMYAENPEECKWLARFQSRVIHDLIRQDMLIRERMTHGSVCVQERDVESVIKVFLPTNEKRFEAIDYRILMDWAKLGRDLNTGVNEKRYIYLDCDASVAYERVKKRGREEEKDMDFEKFSAIHERMSVLKEGAHTVLNTTLLSKVQVAQMVKAIICADSE